MKPAKVLILDTNSRYNVARELREILEYSTLLDIKVEQEIVSQCGLKVEPNEICGLITGSSYDLGFLTLSASLPLAEAVKLLRHLKSRLPQLPVVAVLDDVAPGSALELLDAGAVDFVAAPIREIDILPRLWRLLKHNAKNQEDVPARETSAGRRGLIGESPKFVAELRKIHLLANTGDSILISGETGTGKELCARAIHYMSQRAHKPFVPINCGSIPHDLIENELFGHMRGAFTGAYSMQHGLIHEANGGTLFLDELDGLTTPAQFKLLRFLQEKEYRPLGSTKIYRADVRVVAATNTDPEEAVKTGKIRADLYYRLNILPIRLPPLRERRDDILLLARHFLLQLASSAGRQVQPEISIDAIQKLLFYDWPGNVRELGNVIRRAFVLSEDSIITGRDIMLSQDDWSVPRESFQKVKSKVVAEFEKNYIRELLIAYHGNVSQAAVAAKKNRRALWQLIRKHSIDLESYRSAG